MIIFENSKLQTKTGMTVRTSVPMPSESHIFSNSTVHLFLYPVKCLFHIYLTYFRSVEVQCQFKRFLFRNQLEHFACTRNCVHSAMAE
jgi:hypothetical protein